MPHHRLVVGVVHRYEDKRLWALARELPVLQLDLSAVELDWDAWCSRPGASRRDLGCGGLGPGS